MAGVGRISWWDRVPLPWRRWRVVLEVDAADEIPHKLPRRTAVIVANSGQRTWIAFDCPCTLRHRLLINLEPTRRPFWTVSGAKRLTLGPSVDDITQTRRCHFWLRKGAIQWVHNNSEGPRP